jgi:tryptophan synthase alpha chain
MNRLTERLSAEGKILSIYATAGFPQLKDTLQVLKELENTGVDLIEIGMPFSDPLADGPTIQESSTKALMNGMTTELLFDQLKEVRNHLSIPLILMGYFNPVLQFGVEKFLKKASEIGIDGVILPDLPLEVYEREYKDLFEAYGLSMIFLITPQTPERRIRQIEQASTSFIYMVSTSSTTGAQEGFNQESMEYFKRIEAMNLQVPTVVGFGISNASSYHQATSHSKGAIIGSAFIKALSKEGIEGIPAFVRSIRSSS